MLQAATGMTLHNHRRLSVRIFRVKITALGFLKRDFSFSSNKKQKVVKNHQRMVRKYLFNIISRQKNIYLVTQSL
jgi:hypothetical protein